MSENHMSVPATPKSTKPASAAVPTDTVVRKTASTDAVAAACLRFAGRIPQWQGILFGVACLAIVLGIWWLLTRGPAEERILKLHFASQSPPRHSTASSLHDLWFDNALTRNLVGQLAARRAGICVGGGRGDSAGRSVRLLSLDQCVFRTDECVRTKHSHRGVDSADICVVRNRRSCRR